MCQKCVKLRELTQSPRDNSLERNIEGMGNDAQTFNFTNSTSICILMQRERLDEDECGGTRKRDQVSR